MPMREGSGPVASLPVAKPISGRKGNVPLSGIASHTEAFPAWDGERHRRGSENAPVMRCESN